MLRGTIKWGGIGLAVGLALLAMGTAPAQAGEDSRTAVQFLKALKDRGLHELALDYINILRAETALPAELRAVLDYEEGRALVDEAARTNDLVLRQQLLEEANEKLELFVKEHPQAKESRDALVQIARMLVERGHLALLMSDDTPDKAKKDAKISEARASFSHAHDAYAKAIEPLNTAYKKYAGFIPEGDPRRAERDALYASLLDATLQKGVADYELAQTFPAGSAERAKSIKAALDQFDALYKNYRTQLVGLAAQMWQAKCYEDQGNVGRRHRHLQATARTRRPPLAIAPEKRGILLYRRPGQAQGICRGGRSVHPLARDIQPARRATVARRAGGAV